MCTFTRRSSWTICLVGILLLIASVTVPGPASAATLYDVSFTWSGGPGTTLDATGSGEFTVNFDPFSGSSFQNLTVSWMSLTQTGATTPASGSGGYYPPGLNPSDTLYAELLLDSNDTFAVYIANWRLGTANTLSEVVIFPADGSDSEYTFTGTVNVTPSPHTVVPLPGAAFLFGSGLLGLIGISRRNKTA